MITLNYNSGTLEVRRASPDEPLYFISLAGVDVTSLSDILITRDTPLTNPRDIHSAIIRMRNGDQYIIDIQDVQGAPYASTSELYDEIRAAIDALGGGGGGGVVWGAITGTLSAQTDLQNALTAANGISADLIDLSGVAANATNLGTFTGTTIPDGRKVKQAVQDLETAFEAAVALAAGAEIRTGTSIAFNKPARYNSPATPGNGTITYDLSGAVDTTEVLLFVNNSTEPTWPVGTQRIGMPWNNNQLNLVRFVYTADGITANVSNATTVNYSGPVQTRRITGGSDIITTSTVPTNITGLSFTGTANHTYLILGRLRVSGTALSGVNVGFQGSAAITVNGNYFGPSSAVTAFITGPGNIDGTVATADFSEFATTTNSYIDVAATIVIGGSNTTVNMIVASEVTLNNSTVYVANTFLTIHDHG